MATYNVRNGRAPDLSSFWWTRRRALRDAIRSVDADVWGLQEAYGFQRTFVERKALLTGDWQAVGEGRNGGVRGEQVPILTRRSMFEEIDSATRWFGPTPEVAGSQMPGASLPRIATMAKLVLVGGGVPLRIVNLHLDSESMDRRTASLHQLAEWLAARDDFVATVVMGDFNGPMTDPGYSSLTDLGLRSALPPDAGPTSNGFGMRLGLQRQIDHVFVSSEIDVVAAEIDVTAGHASDHYPVVVDLELRAG